MTQSLINIPVHFVFSTKNRRCWIKSDIENELYQYICGICRNLGSPVIQINGVEDHVHILLCLGRTITICKLISEIKSNSSRWIKSKGEDYRDFCWQSGYGGFAVASMYLENVIKYVSSQKEHHKRMTFKEELLGLLKRANIPYDERYLWD